MKGFEEGGWQGKPAYKELSWLYFLRGACARHKGKILVNERKGSDNATTAVLPSTRLRLNERECGVRYDDMMGMGGWEGDREEFALKVRRAEFLPARRRVSMASTFSVLVFETFLLYHINSAAFMPTGLARRHDSAQGEYDN